MNNSKKIPKDTTLYAVFKYAVYRHQCGGVYSTKELAIEAATLLKSKEKDDHHDYEIVPFVLNRIPEFIKDQYAGDPLETDPIWDSGDIIHV